MQDFSQVEDEAISTLEPLREKKLQCNATYIGETYRTIKHRLQEHTRSYKYGEINSKSATHSKETNYT